MSMNFDQPVNPEALAKIKEAFGEPVATDGKTLLFDRLGELHGRVMKEIANTAKQPAVVEINGDGEIKTLSDGTQYRVTPQGWQKIDAL